MKKLKIHFLNTIWSDAIILESNNHYAFVDTGSAFYYPMIKKHLEDLNITKIDFILLTHFHSDHYGCCDKLIVDFDIEKLYLKRYYGLDGTTSSGYASNEEYIENEFNNYNKILKAAADNNTIVTFIDELDSDNIQINFDNHTLDLFQVSNLLNDLYSNPKSNFYHQKRFNENFNSLGIFMKVNDFNIYLGGDVTCSNTDIEEVRELSIKMTNSIYQKYNINKIHIYKSCHHGGGGTNTLPLCKLINPDFVFITNTARWLDNWPTINNLLEANSNVQIFTTDFQKYFVNISDTIEVSKEIEDSLFITLKKD